MILHQRPLRIIYNTLPLTKSTLFTADTILWCTKILLPTDDFRFLFHRKRYNPQLYCVLLSHLISCTTTKSNLHLANSLAAAAAVSKPALYGILTSRAPNLTSIFRCLCRTRVSVQVRGFLCKRFVTQLTQTNKLEDHTISAVRDILFNIFAATVHTGDHSSIRKFRPRHVTLTGTR